jgi:hypothetical protein
MLGFVALTPTYGSRVLTLGPLDRLPCERAPGRGWPTGRRPSSLSPGRRMAASPVQACVREVARQGQAICGVRFFRRFLCALKEKIVGNDFSRQPRRGEAQGCVEQIGSGASPRSIRNTARRFAPETNPTRKTVRTFSTIGNAKHHSSNRARNRSPYLHFRPMSASIKLSGLVLSNGPITCFLRHISHISHL